MFISSGGFWVGTVAAPYFYSILLITLNVMSHFLFNSLFKRVNCIILKFNISRYPIVYEKIRKSLYGTVLFTIPTTVCLITVRVHTYPRRKAVY